MPIKSEVKFDPVKRVYEVKTKIEELDVVLCRNEQDLIREISCQIALKVADKVMERLAPAIDRALKEI